MSQPVKLLSEQEIEGQELVDGADDSLVLREDLERLLAIARWAAQAQKLLNEMLVTRYVPVWIRMRAGDLLAAVTPPKEGAPRG